MYSLSYPSRRPQRNYYAAEFVLAGVAGSCYRHCHGPCGVSADECARVANLEWIALLVLYIAATILEDVEP